jgi:hypothetical protein
MSVFALLLFYLLQSLSLLLSQNKGSLLLTTVSEKTPSCRSCLLRQLHHCLLKILQCLSFIVLSMRERKLNSEKFKKDKSIDLKVGHPLYKFFWSKSWRGASLCTLTRILEHCELSTVLWRHIYKSSYLRCTDWTPVDQHATWEVDFTLPLWREILHYCAWSFHVKQNLIMVDLPLVNNFLKDITWFVAVTRMNSSLIKC